MRHLGVIAGRKNFVGRGDLIPAHGFFNDRDAMLTKQPDHALPGDAVQKRTVGNGRINNSVLGGHQICIGKLGHIAKHVEEDAVVKTAGIGFEQRARIVRIQASGLGVDRHAVDGRTPIGRQRYGEARFVRHRRFIDAKAPFGGRRIEANAAAGRAVARPIHRADIKLGTGIEMGDAFTHKLKPPLHRDLIPEHQLLGGLVDPRAMQLDIGKNAVECARAVEDRRAEPCAMGARTHDPDIAVVPTVFEKGDGSRHLASTQCGRLRSKAEKIIVKTCIIDCADVCLCRPINRARVKLNNAD